MDGGLSLLYPMAMPKRKGVPMTYSFTQISNYLRCPRSYRHRYLDGWREKETRAAMIFGRRFEKALGAYFCDDDCGAVLHPLRANISETSLVPLINEQKGEKEEIRDEREFSWCCSFLWGFG